MLIAPLIRYELVKAEQRARWQEAARARKARAATHDQAGRVEPVEAASDLTGLVERVIQNVWKRLGLPAREGGAPPLLAPSGGLPLGESGLVSDPEAQWHRLSVLARVADRLSRAQRRHR